jgi:nucleoside-diphosphate-sugar epimerase
MPGPHVLVVGACGFIGREVARRLELAGCVLTVHGRSLARLTRLFPHGRHCMVDLAENHGWAATLAGIDVVVFAAGIMGERGGDRYAAVHERAAVVLIDACAAAGVRRFVLVSAAGTELEASAYWRSKRAAERHLQAAAGLDGVVVRPSVVVGRGGGSDGLFRGLAALPLLPDIVGDPGRLRPIHVADLAEAIARLVLQAPPVTAMLDAGGPEPMTLAAMLSAYRRALDLPPAPRLRLPSGLLLAAAAAASTLGAPPPLHPEPVRLLQLAPDIDPEPLTRSTGVEPRPLAEALARDMAARGDLAEARMVFLGLLARLALALLWLGSGLLSLSPWATPSGAALLAELGLTGGIAQLLLFGAAGLDIAIGALLVVNRWPLAVGVAQLGLIALLTLILTLGAPHWWLHPFGPLLKNLPVVALVLVVMAREGR